LLSNSDVSDTWVFQQYITYIRATHELPRQTLTKHSQQRDIKQYGNRAILVEPARQRIPLLIPWARAANKSLLLGAVT